MNKEDLLELKKKIEGLSEEEKKQRDLYLRKLALGEIYGPLTGYASIDKPWLKYYGEEQIKCEIPYMTVYEYLKKLNSNRLDYTAIDSIEGTYTFKQLFENIDRVADSLYGMEIGKGRKVMMMLPPTPYESILFYATDKVGGIITEVPIQTMQGELLNKINKFDIDILFISDFLLKSEMENVFYENTGLKNIVVIGSYDKEKYDERTISWADFLERGKGINTTNIDKDPDDLLFIASTGGSTGEPKSVMLSDNCFNIAVHQYINSDLKYNVGDRWLRLWSLFSASAAVSNNHLPLCAGMTSVIRNFPLNINDFDKMVYDIKPEHLMLIPQLLDVLEKSELLKNKDLGFIKTIGCGGLAITNQFEERVNNFFKIHNMETFLGYGWGCTESFTLGSIRSNFNTNQIGSVGAPHVDTIVSSFDHDTLEERKFGETGELCIKSLVTMLGYYDDKEMSLSVLKKHNDGTFWLHTGDLGFVAENGIVTVKGRMTRTIFVFPTAKIYPTSLENIICKIPGVVDAIVGEMPDPKHDGFGLPICFVIPEADVSQQVLERNIKDVCCTCMADYARPQIIQFMKEFPLTKVGKKDVKLLEKSIYNKNLTFTNTK